MDSPTKRFKRSTAKFIRGELAATRSSASFPKLAAQIGAAIIVGVLISFVIVVILGG